MSFRIIPPIRKEPNKYDLDYTFQIPVKIVAILKDQAQGRVIPIIVERLDFFSGELKLTKGITFQGSVEIFESAKIELPFITNGLVFKEYNNVFIKVVGLYNPGLVERIYEVQNHILNNDENQIMNLYNNNYQELRNWIGNINTNLNDVILK